MAAPDILNLSGFVADNEHICGPLVITFAVTAMFESTRNVKHVNVLIGVWLVVAPLLFQYQSTSAIVNEVLSGAAIALLSFVKSKRSNHFNGGWAMLFKRR